MALFSQQKQTTKLIEKPSFSCRPVIAAGAAPVDRRRRVVRGQHALAPLVPRPLIARRAALVVSATAWRALIRPVTDRLTACRAWPRPRIHGPGDLRPRSGTSRC